MALQLGSLSTLSDTSGFDWASEENAIKWKGQFVGPLAKVLYHTHPQFVADEESLVYVESLLIKLLAMITAKPAPTTVSDVEVRK
jgi:son of sevenless-like protein